MASETVTASSRKAWSLVAIALAVLLPTRQARAFTLVGNSALQGWQTDLLEIHLNPDQCPIPEAELTQALDRAIDLWNSVPTSSIRLTRGVPVATTPVQAAAGTGTSGTPTPVILCDPNLGTTLGVGVDDDVIPASTSNKAVGLTLNYAYILLNADPSARANVSRLSNLKLSMVLAHEIGHVLGLGHTRDPQNLMYFDVTLRTELSLSQDDIDGVTYLYPRHELGENGLLGCGVLERPRGDGGKGPGLELPGLLLWAAGVVAVFKACSRNPTVEIAVDPDVDGAVQIPVSAY